MVRQAVVQQLVSAANEGMSSAAQGSTSGEVFSAYLTMAKRAVRVARESGADMSGFRMILEGILLECADESVVH